ncbi:bifunctional hydroxymethylpyrimidine kinase/phosphomethylpyrimidine kinase [Tessaracoccus sp. MC1756]|uniref:bifunctional hydroxymethylpyrimidine kinase/phosphomethylpyrimidine kinase n=1 Tax=Tessaracoccus sp. MC1756 TaxID=2760311 RepID=UPI0016005093|nr:bifunctional hydroxymethylpyrimidine kinase/phosphomethylpyrimidine kinase [Tessaracoccus sp. MC1756]MBB1509899.1 bifunctional hydroxymethylpyrimidine kinase/phosphomethylpyrimidine kinase [Tessaracoccus sp. MC1756]
MTTPRIALSIAGSDPSGGAGIQADLKTFHALGVYGTAALAGLTAQNTQGVREARAVDPAFVRSQIEAVLDDLPVAATKLGMLSNAEVAGVVADLLEERRADFGVVVLDPVMVATSGDTLLQDDAVAVVRERLMRLADVITPNVPEAAVLLGTSPAMDSDGVIAQAKALVGAGARAALVKGGHLSDDEVTDAFATADGVAILSGPRIRSRHTHGTGCTLSSAIAAHAARNGDTLRTGVRLPSIEQARDYLMRAIASGAGWTLSRTPDLGHGPVDHFVEGTR